MANIYTVEYEGRFENGKAFDASPKGQPLEFISGVGAVIYGFEKGIEGMEIGEEKEIKIEPEEGYGDTKQELIMKMPKKVLEGMPEVKAGMEIVATLESGEQVPVKILNLGADSVTLDFNHPLAGKTLIFKVKLLDKQKASKEEIERVAGKRNSTF